MTSPRRGTQFPQTFEPDPIPDNLGRFDSPDLMDIHLRIAGTQQVAADTKIATAAGTAYEPTLDGSGGIAIGDVVGSASAAGGLAKHATGTIDGTGIATAAADAGKTAPTQTTGIVPASITGLGAGAAAYAVRDTTTGRTVRKAAIGAGDDVRGKVDSQGCVNLSATHVDKIAAKAMAGEFGTKPSATGTDNGAKLQLAINAAALATHTLTGAEGGSGGAVELEAGAYYHATAYTLDSGASPSCDGMSVHCPTRSGASGLGLSHRQFFNGTTPRTGAAGTITAFDGATWKATFGGLTGMTANDVNTILYVTGGTHSVNRGAYLITDYVSATSVKAIKANGPAGVLTDTGLTWTLTQSVLYNVHARDTITEGLTLNVNGGAILGAGISCTQSTTGGSSISTNNQFKNCRVSDESGDPNGIDASSAVMLCGLVWGDSLTHPGGVSGGFPPDCDNGLFDKCFWGACKFACVWSPNTFGQTKDIVFNRNSFNAAPFGVLWSTGSVFLNHCNFGDLTRAAISVTGTTEMVEVTDADEEGCPVFIQGNSNLSLARTPLVVKRGRYSCNAVIAGLPYIAWTGTGTVLLEDMVFDQVYNANVQFAFGSAGQPLSVTAIGCEFPNEFPFSTTPMVDANGATNNCVFRLTMIGCKGLDSGGNVIVLPDQIGVVYSDTQPSLNAGLHGISVGPGGAVSGQRTDVTLANGANHDISLRIAGSPHIAWTSAFARITGPTGAFSVGGFVCYGQLDGMQLTVFNTTAQAMTLVNEDASSTAEYRIKTLTGADIVLAARTTVARFIYDNTYKRLIYTGGA